MKLSDSEFTDLAAFIQRVCGITIPITKKYLIEQRLGHIVKERGCASYGEYYNKLSANKIYAGDKELIEAITTNETSFFRDIHPFKSLQDIILPGLIERFKQEKFRDLSKTSKIRIWSAASSYGQELYSIGMTIDRTLQSPEIKNIRLNDFELLGTDISDQVLDISRQGIYSNLEVGRGLTEADKQEYFTQTKAGWAVRPALKTISEFRRMNLLNNLTTLGSFDIIFCRNVLIYFDTDTRNRIISQLYSILADDGYLVLGASENLYGVSSEFKSERIGGSVFYRKTQQKK